MSFQYPPHEWQEIGSFIRSKREQLKPQQEPRRRRHVHHLTQAELAERAGLSTVIVSKVEQGQYPNLNPRLVQKFCQALALDPSSERYLQGLLVPAPEDAVVRTEVPAWVSESINQLEYPVNVLNPRFDIVAWNHMSTRLLGDLGPMPPKARNTIWMMFCVPQLKLLFQDWEEGSRSMVSAMKLTYALVPEYRQPIGELVREIAETEPTFTAVWEQVDPMFVPRIHKRIHHPTLGELEFYEVITQLVGNDMLTMVAFVPATEATREVFTHLGRG